MSVNTAGTAVDPTDRNKTERDVLGVVAGMKVIASPNVTPPGNALWFWKYGVIVLGAGVGVDSLPAVVAPPAPPRPLSDLEAEVARLEEGTKRQELETKIAALKNEKGQAA